MAKTLNIWCGQISLKMGDFTKNKKAILDTWQEGKTQNAHLVVTPECAICGYPPEDLLLKKSFIQTCMAEVEALAALTKDGPPLLVGTPWRAEGYLFNAAVLLKGGRVHTVACKRELPNYGVFDEQRYFQKGPNVSTVELAGTTVGIAICEDLWLPTVAKDLKERGAKLIVSINASPYEEVKTKLREETIRHRAVETNLPIVYVNTHGGQDELIFDGHSFLQNPQEHTPIFKAIGFEDAAFMATFENGYLRSTAPSTPQMPPFEVLYKALCCGTRDYVHGNGFKKVVIGLSGGVDSALVAKIAVDALGAENVVGLLMPSPYSSGHSVTDAQKLAQNLNIKTHTITIEKGMAAFTKMLTPVFTAENAPTEHGITEENIQARLRGMLLMAYSNKFGAMVLTTGNKSEMSVGYATLYGDMNGGFNPIKDLYKTKVFALCKHLNEEQEVIPNHILTKPPSAELSPDQKDSDSLPDYPTLDAILKLAIEEHKNQEEVIKKGFNPATVGKIFRLLRLAEYKRRQACPGVKVGQVAFGRDFRFPITNKARGY